MKVLVEFFWNCGRMGVVQGLFTCHKSELDSIIGREVYFGEILGKHSEISGTLNQEDFTIKSEDQEFIQKLEEILGEGTIQGYNPFDYIEDFDDEEEDE